ncbi:MAG: type II toxin-antitoxin system RelE/ParE family toxin [Acidithiobacillus ferrooxidans]|nr:type II toxin-antitoxin system RelE/ParE family toxin [Acidithiobacillus ferrooxidans]MDD5004308.1 type II toxin-antitoxin system RelE/ParE family toxin [Acidithiobacillus sp.]MDD5575498.1 type II toxin-antitoxin system RelE/ParE family toxin [Acidithiobacillus sp.]
MKAEAQCDASRAGKDTSGARKPILPVSATRDKRRAMVYSLSMIKSFRHKGLEAFYRSGSKAGIQPDHATKLRVLLTALDAAESAEQMNAPGWRLHRLTGHYEEYWSVRVNGNWRVIFRFEGIHGELVDYVDYH